MTSSKRGSSRNRKETRIESKRMLMKRARSAVLTSIAASLFIGTTMMSVSRGLANGEHFHIPLLVLALDLILLVAAISSILAWSRAQRKRG